MQTTNNPDYLKPIPWPFNPNIVICEKNDSIPHMPETNLQYSEGYSMNLKNNDGINNYDNGRGKKQMKKAVKKGRKNFDKRPLEMKYAKNKPPMAVTKRNERERTRVHIVNQAFVDLKGHLPSIRTNLKRVSKLKILKAAINYINTLTSLLQEYPSRNSKFLAMNRFYGVNAKNFTELSSINQENSTFSNSRNPFHRRMAPKDSDPKKLLVEAAPSLHFHEDSQAIVSSFYNNPVYLHNYNMQSFPYH